MFQVKPLARRTEVRFNVRPMVKKTLAPHQDRASFIAMECKNGKSYAQAVRSWDKKVRANV